MELTLNTRQLTGKALKKERLRGLIPVSVYGKDFTARSFFLENKEEAKDILRKGENFLFDLAFDGKTQFKVLASEIQIHPVTQEVLHVSFYKVNLKEKVTANVPVEAFGESEIIKSGQGILLEVLSEIEVRCFPTDIPEKFVVSIEGLKEINQVICVKDIIVDKNKIEVLDDSEEVVFKVDYAEQKEEVLEKTEEELLSEVKATKELTEEEKQKREEDKKEEKKVAESKEK